MEVLKFSNGDAMPAIGLGTWKSAPGEVYHAVREALRLGYRHLDCAFIYENEAEIGRALADTFSSGEIKREEIWVTSKLWNSSHAPEDVAPAIEKSLADLQLEYLDLYLVHWPVALKKGVLFPNSAEDMVSLDEIPLEATWAAMEGLVGAGRARHIGVSNFSIKKLGALLETAKHKPEVNQIELHPYLQQQEMLEFAKGAGVHLTAYSPLGSPDRPARLKGKEEPALLEAPVVREIAQQHDASPAQVLIRWAIERGTSVIPKSVNPERLAQNLAAAELSLSSEQMERLASLDQHFRYVDGTFWAMEGSSYTLDNLWD